jgi:hypothetical protein
MNDCCYLRSLASQFVAFIQFIIAGVFTSFLSLLKEFTGCCKQALQPAILPDIALSS